MSITSWLFFGFLVVVVYLMTPALLVHGWIRWTRLPKLNNLVSYASAGGFVLATASVSLALLTIAYAQVHHFGYYDPTLMRIERIGFLLSLAGLFVAVCGTFRRSALRWHAPLAAFGTLAFWVLARLFE